MDMPRSATCTLIDVNSRCSPAGLLPGRCAWPLHEVGGTGAHLHPQARLQHAMLCKATTAVDKYSSFALFRQEGALQPKAVPRGEAAELAAQVAHLERQVPPDTQ